MQPGGEDEDGDDLADLDFRPAPVAFRPLEGAASMQASDPDWDGFMPAPPTPAAPPPVPAKESLRVDLDRVDRLIDLAGELVITQAMLAERVSDKGIAEESDIGLALADLHQLTRDLQDSVMAMRAQSVKSVFQRMSRLVRELEAATGKAVDLQISG